MDVLGSACWLPSWEKGNHKNTETESGKNYAVLLMHLHQTHWGSKALTPENGEHCFLIIIFWWLACAQLSQTCLFALARSAVCQRPGGTGRLSWHLAPGQPVIGTWTRASLCGKDPAWGDLAVGQHSWYSSSPPAPPPARSGDSGLPSEIFLPRPFYVTTHLYF